MRTHSIKMHLRPISTKSLVFITTPLTRIQRITNFSTQFFDVHFVNTPTNFLVWCKQNPNVAMRHFRMIHHLLHKIHNHRHTRLIVCSQQCRSTRRNYIITNSLQQIGMVFGRYHLRCIIGQHQILTLIIPVNQWLNPFPSAIRRSIHVGTKTQNRHFMVHIRRQRSIHISVFIQMSIGQSHL